MAIRRQHGKGRFEVDDGSGNVEERDLEWTAIILTKGYMPPEGSGVPEGTMNVLVYRFKDEKGGVMVNYCKGLYGKHAPFKTLDDQLRTLLNKEVEPIRRGELGVENHPEGEEVDVYEKLGLDPKKDIVVTEGTATIEGKKADWTQYSIGNEYVPAEPVSIEGVPVTNVKVVNEYCFRDQGGQTLQVILRTTDGTNNLINTLANTLALSVPTEHAKEMDLTERKGQVVKSYEAGNEVDVAELLHI